MGWGAPQPADPVGSVLVALGLVVAWSWWAGRFWWARRFWWAWPHAAAEEGRWGGKIVLLVGGLTLLVVVGLVALNCTR